MREGLLALRVGRCSSSARAAAHTGWDSDSMHGVLWQSSAPPETPFRKKPPMMVSRQDCRPRAAITACMPALRGRKAPLWQQSILSASGQACRQVELCVTSAHLSTTPRTLASKLASTFEARRGAVGACEHGEAQGRRQTSALHRSPGPGPGAPPPAPGAPPWSWSVRGAGRRRRTASRAPSASRRAGRPVPSRVQVRL